MAKKKYDDQTLFSEEYVEAKEQKPREDKVDEMVESIFSFPSTGLEHAQERQEKAGKAKGEPEATEYAYGPSEHYENKEAFKPTPRPEAPRDSYKDLTEVLGKSGGSIPLDSARYDNTPYEGLGANMISEKEAGIRRKEREAEWVRAGKLPWESITEAERRREKEGLKPVEKYPEEEPMDAVVRKVGRTSLNPIDAAVGAKGYLSENKLKYEASRYGITPEDFDKYKREGKLSTVKMIVDAGKQRELYQKGQEAREAKTRAETKGLTASTAKRYAETERIEATLPVGGRKLVQFGSSNFGQTPHYVNAAGTHGQMRSQFIPGQMSGVSTALANSRLEIARMKQRVLSGPGGNINAVQALMPQSDSTGIISRLAGNQGPKPPYGGGMGVFKPSVLTKLGALRPRRP